MPENEMHVRRRSLQAPSLHSKLFAATPKYACFLFRLRKQPVKRSVWSFLHGAQSSSAGSPHQRQARSALVSLPEGVLCQMLLASTFICKLRAARVHASIVIFGSVHFANKDRLRTVRAHCSYLVDRTAWLYLVLALILGLFLFVSSHTANVRSKRMHSPAATHHTLHPKTETLSKASTLPVKKIGSILIPQLS